MVSFEPIQDESVFDMMDSTSELPSLTAVVSPGHVQCDWCSSQLHANNLRNHCLQKHGKIPQPGGPADIARKKIKSANQRAWVTKQHLALTAVDASDRHESLSKHVELQRTEPVASAARARTSNSLFHATVNLNLLKPYYEFQVQLEGGSTAQSTARENLSMLGKFLKFGSDNVPDDSLMMSIDSEQSGLRDMTKIDHFMNVSNGL